MESISILINSLFASHLRFSAEPWLLAPLNTHSPCRVNYFLASGKGLCCSVFFEATMALGINPCGTFGCIKEIQVWTRKSKTIVMIPWCGWAATLNSSSTFQLCASSAGGAGRMFFSHFFFTLSNVKYYLKEISQLSPLPSVPPTLPPSSTRLLCPSTYKQPDSTLSQQEPALYFMLLQLRYCI